MRATGSFNGYRNNTIGTFFGCGCSWRSFLFLFELVDTANEEKDGKSHDNEVNDRIDENPHVHRDRSRSFGGCHGSIGSGGLAFLQNGEDVGEINIPQEQPG